MTIIPEQTLQEILNEDAFSKVIFENYGIDVEKNTDRTLNDISESRILPIASFIEDLTFMLNHKN